MKKFSDAQLIAWSQEEDAGQDEQAIYVQ